MVFGLLKNGVQAFRPVPNAGTVLRRELWEWNRYSHTTCGLWWNWNSFL